MTLLKTTLKSSDVKEVNHETFRNGLNNTAENPTQVPPQATDTPKTEPIKQVLEDINVSQMSDENPDMVTVDWGAQKSGEPYAFFDGKTEQKADDPGAKTSGSDNKVPPSSGEPGAKFNKDTFRVGVKVLVQIIDFLMATGLRILAKGKNDSEYRAKQASKDILEDSIIDILDEHKVRIPPGLIVLFAFLSAYAFQIMGAIADRKKNMEDAEKRENLIRANEELKIQRAEERRRVEEEKINKGEPIFDKTQKVHVPNEQGIVIVDEVTTAPGIFMKDGKEYRRYKSGAVRPTKYKDGVEILVGKPANKAP